MIDEADRDGDGEVNEEEFFRWLRRALGLLVTGPAVLGCWGGRGRVSALGHAAFCALQLPAHAQACSSLSQPLTLSCIALCPCRIMKKTSLF